MPSSPYGPECYVLCPSHLPCLNATCQVIPLMDKALSPYVKGGGAKQYEEELKKLYGMDGSIDSTVGGFQVRSLPRSHCPVL